MIVTRSRTPYDVDFKSPAGEELDNLSIHITVEPFLTALEARYPGKADRVEVVDYCGHDKESTGMTPLQFVTRQRITRAQQLIRETSRTLIEVGLEVGYNSPSHFAQVFRRETGLTPKDYRRQW
jgi:methylphosphotriester-DNA--protein-cysteine methyltransferase